MFATLCRIQHTDIANDCLLMFHHHFYSDSLKSVSLNIIIIVEMERLNRSLRVANSTWIISRESNA